MAPAELSVVRVPLTRPLMMMSPLVVIRLTWSPPSTGPMTVSVRSLARSKPLALKLPSASTWLTGSSMVLPTERPASVPAVTMPLAVWLMLPPETSVTVSPCTAWVRARSPAELRPTSPPRNAELTDSTPDDVVRCRRPPLAIVSGPLADSACALVKSKPAALKLPRVPTRLAPLSAVTPVERPVSVAAVITP